MRKKVLLMGKSGSGKSSMRSIVFSNYVAKDTRRLGATIDVEHSHVRFLGNLVLNLWDCGGQDAFMENYLASQRDHIFRNVEVLIYVFDVESREFDRDLHTYSQCVDALAQNSPDAQVFCLIHKMDLVQEEARESLFQDRQNALRERTRLRKGVTCLATTIWDETLYKAWSSIVYTLIPNIPTLERHLAHFAEIAEAEEVVLFERTTFLVISHAAGAQDAEHPDPHRFEKISNIVKQFKLSCSKMQSQFNAFELRAHNFSAFIDVLTPNTYIMVVMSDPAVQSATTLMNIATARKYFDKIEANDRGSKDQR
ncbi:GTP-binding protein gtr1 [Saitoella coloradoensis]